VEQAHVHDPDPASNPRLAFCFVQVSGLAYVGVASHLAGHLAPVPLSPALGGYHRSALRVWRVARIALDEKGLDLASSCLSVSPDGATCRSEIQNTEGWR
jgi:hypothetical protein